MTRPPREWIEFGVVLLSMVLITVFAAGFLNLTGDCAPEVTRCGETQRRISVVVLGFGLVAIGYYIVRFLRQHH